MYTMTIKAQFLLSINNFINKLIKHHCATTISQQEVCFYWGYFLRHVKCTPVFPDGIEMALAALNKAGTALLRVVDCQMTDCCCYPLI